MDKNELFKLCYQLNPCVVHGTSIENMPSILKNGLLSGKSLDEKKIASKKQEPFVQKQNKKEHMISCWRIGDEDERWDNEKKRIIVFGKLSKKERYRQIKSLIHPYCNDHHQVKFLIRKKVHSEKPDWQNFGYEGLMNEIRHISKDNIIAVTLDEKRLIDEYYGRSWIKKAIRDIEKEFLLRKIPFIKDY